MRLHSFFFSVFILIVELQNTESIWITGTITPYRFFKNRLKYSPHPSQISPGANYSPKKIHIFHRHGDRTPGKETEQRVKYNLKPIASHILQLDENFYPYCKNFGLENWKVKRQIKNPHGEKTLTNIGRSAVVGIAKRFKKTFPEIFDNYLEAQARVTDTERTRSTLKFFLITMYGEEYWQEVQTEVVSESDRILEFDYECYHWRFTVKDNSKSKLNTYTKLFLEPIAQEIGQICGMNFDIDNLKLVYELCIYETGWNVESNWSQWCNLLAYDGSWHRLVQMQYLEDLETYLIDGYDNDLNWQIASPMMYDAYNFLTNDNGKVFHINVGHISTITKFIAYLGFHNYGRHLNEYGHFWDTYDGSRWTTSNQMPFATNIAFILYESSDDDEEPYILTMLNEEVVRLPYCQDNGHYFCPLWSFRDNVIHDVPSWNDLCLIEDKTYRKMFNKFLQKKSEKRLKEEEAEVEAAARFHEHGFQEDDEEDDEDAGYEGEEDEEPDP